MIYSENLTVSGQYRTSPGRRSPVTPHSECDDEGTGTGCEVMRTLVWRENNYHCRSYHILFL